MTSTPDDGDSPAPAQDAGHARAPHGEDAQGDHTPTLTTDEDAQRDDLLVDPSTS